MIARIAVVCLCLLTGACAIGNQHKYDATSAKIGETSSNVVAVAVQDSRPYVLSGEKEANFVGLSRGGFGNPFNVTTSTDKPLAQDMTLSIVSALQASGTTAKGVDLPSGSTASDTLSIIMRTTADRYAWMVLNEWKSDTYVSARLIYDVMLRIYDKNGNQLADKRLVGEDFLGADAFNPPGMTREMIPPAFQKKIEELFNDPKIAGALG